MDIGKGGLGESCERQRERRGGINQTQDGKEGSYFSLLLLSCKIRRKRNLKRTGVKSSKIG